MSSDSINVRPLGDHIGAQIEGIDISRTLSPADFNKIHDALTAYQVIFFRDQELTDGELIAFGRRFGPLYIHPYAPKDPDHPEVVILKSMLARADVWHSDATFQEKPPLGSFLFAHEVPDNGCDTMFANMYMADETLSEPMRRYLESLNALNHPGGASYGKGKEELSEQDKAEMSSGRTTEAGTVHPRGRHGASNGAHTSCERAQGAVRKLSLHQENRRRFAR